MKRINCKNILYQQYSKRFRELLVLIFTKTKLSSLYLYLCFSYSDNYFPCNCQLLKIIDTPIVKTQPLFLSHNFCVSPYSLHGSAIASVNVSAIEPCAQTQDLTNYSSSSKTYSSSSFSLNNLQYSFSFVLCGIGLVNHILTYILIDPW